MKKKLVLAMAATMVITSCAVPVLADDAAAEGGKIGISMPTQSLERWNRDGSYLEEQLGDGGTVMNLTGCTLEEVLYQVSAQRPVIVSLGDAGNRVIVGYDAYNTLLYNPADQTTSYMGINDSTAAFEKAGNVFISYIEKKIE